MTIPEGILAQEIVGLKAEIKYNVGKKKLYMAGLYLKQKT
jgi:hypothetical protein